MSPSPWDAAPPAPAIRLAYGDHPSQFGDLRLPSGPGPHRLVIMLHGGFWRARYDLGYFADLCAALTTLGLATWNVEYRRLGEEGGNWPGTLLDVAHAADWVRQLATRYPITLDGLAALGHSAGGHLALWLAGRRRIAPHSALFIPDPVPFQAVIGAAPVSDLEDCYRRGLSGGVVVDLLGGTPEETPERYAAASPSTLLPLGVRQFLVHGSQDDDVPIAMSESYVAAARAAGDDVTFLPLRGVDHFAPIEPASAVWPLVQEAMLEALRGRGGEFRPPARQGP